MSYPFRIDKAEKEKKKLEKALKLFTISSVLHRTLNIDEVYNIVLDTVKQIIGGKDCSILIKSSVSSKLELTVYNGKKSIGSPIVSYPLKLGDENIGEIHINSLLPQKDILSEYDRELLALLAEHAGLAIIGANLYKSYSMGIATLQKELDETFNAEELLPDGKLTPEIIKCFNSKVEKIIATGRRLKEINIFLKELSIKDGLTGIFNHRHFYDVLQQEFVRAKRYNLPLSCLIIDIDFFKVVNDKYGHKFGDFVLLNVANCLKENCREIDILARYGGEEFVILALNTDSQGAITLSEKLRNIIESYLFKDGKYSTKITISIGVSSLFEDHIKIKEDLVNFADQALYTAKRNGRNMTVFYEQS